jgi:CDP-diacylglycerol--serine O-phosphatidyltransferase
VKLRVRKGGGRLRRLDIKKSLFVLPNMITMAAVFCGFNAIRVCAKPGANTDDFHRAAVLLLFAMLFDLLDGRVARMTRTQSAFGLQLDSLADVISFGVAPALLVYQWVLHRYPVPGLVTAFMFAACAAARLARFNVLSSAPSGAPIKPGKYIVGLPTPPASGVLIALVVADSAVGGELGAERFTPVFFGVTILVSLLMVSNVRFRSFKDLELSRSGVVFVAFVLGSSALVSQLLRPHFVLIWLLGMYITVGLFESARAVARRLAQPAVARDTVPPAK